MGNSCCTACPCPRRWTEGVRKEWLSVVPGTGEDEGAADPLRTPCPIDDAPLTGTHSREEIESLIRARCELGCPLSGNDLTRDYVSPENLAAELERELLALKLHVARSHALLHHYQSSSLHGSRSEVSTPPGAGPHHVQGVEAGVECDLCGPTCLPRPCGSAATQTPASPAPATPECEESAAAATALWEADEGASVTEDLLQEDGDHQSLTPQHRALRQCLEVKEEEEEEEEEEEVVVIGVEDTTDMASEHTLYAPKPAYDQLDQYRSTSRRKGDEKLRRTGLTTVSPQQVDGSTDGEESECEEIRARPIRRSRPLVHIHQTRITDPEGAPLSPPPSLDNVDEEEEDPLTKEEVLLPSTPESGSSVTSADLFCHLTDGTTSGSNESGVRSLNPPSSPVAEVDSNVPAVPVCTSTRPGPLSSTPATSVTLSTPAVPTAPATPTTPASPTAPANPECVGAGRVERSKSCSAVFPSLHDPFLRTVGLSRDDPIPNENLSAQEIEGKFTQLSLAFKTDRLTLRQRLDVQQRQRDTAETNFETEINQLRSSILALHADCVDSELVDAITQVRRHLDILATSSIRLVSASEVWGAVQQEWRVSRALEVLLLHVENVKRMYERDHLELEELRRLLNEYQIELPVSTGTVSGTNQSPADSQAVSRRVRALSLAGCTNKQQTQENRRISLSSGTAKTAANAFLASRGSRRRASLMPDLKPFKEHLAAVAAAAAAAASATSPSVTASATSKEKTEENGQPSNGVWGSSITEEGSESGEEGNDCTLMTSSNATPNSSISRALAQLHPDLYPAEQTPQDSDRRLSEESNLSSVSQSIDADAATPSTPAPSPNPIPQHWLMVAVDDVMGWIRGGRWPYSPQETVQGARYAFTSLLLLLAAFFLLLTISYGDSNVPQPYHPGWTTIHHVLHPFVAVRYMGIPPT